jgi:bifunctional enzyme CysN/CysC
MNQPIVRLVACGSVDDGKSTLIGRLLVETDNVPDDTVAAARATRRSGSTIKAGEIDFSLITDGLEAEREQGITIDVAYRSMNLSDGRRLIIADAPGHDQYTRNMAVAASRADLALVLVDATRGVRAQTLRHLHICSLMGVSKIVIVINKLDGVDYSQHVFQSIQSELENTISRHAIVDAVFVPVSALSGDNVVSKSDNLAWYEGLTLLGYIEKFSFIEPGSSHPRLGVQLISRSDGFRGVAGTVQGGDFCVGDEIRVLPAGTVARISSISTFDGALSVAEAGRAITLTLEPEIDVSRGDVIELAATSASAENRFEAHLVWLGEEALATSRSYLMVSGSTQVPCVVTRIKHSIDTDDGTKRPAVALAMNDIGLMELATNSPIALTSYKQSRQSGGFILIDRVSMRTVGAGMVSHALRRSANIFLQEYDVTRDIRAGLKNQKPKVIWLTGLSGSGKSTIANALEKRFIELGKHAYVLDGDNLRLGLNKDLGFTREDRAENVRRVAEVSRLLYEAGLIVIVALVSPFGLDRDQARALFPKGDFLEVWVNTSVEVCVKRDSKGLYAKASGGMLPNLTGVGQEYEPPEEPELVLVGEAAISENVDTLLRLLVE